MFPVIGAARSYWGFLGVEIFFLLSGYLIGGILIASLFDGELDKLSGIVSFWKRRWFRTLPNYFLFLVLLLLLFHFRTGNFPPKSGSYFWFGQAILSAYPDLFFTAAWSLSVEEWFYVLFPAVLFALTKLMAKRKNALVSTILIFLIVPLIIRGFFCSPENSQWDWDGGIRKVTLPRLDAIGYGVVLAFCRSQRSEIWRFLVRIWPVGMVATLGLFGHFCWHVVSTSSGFSSNLFVFRVFYFCLMSLSLALVFPKVVEMAQPANWSAVVVRKLSLWSYSIYLSHVFFDELIGISLKPISPHLHGLEPLVGGALIWLTTIPSSALLYSFFEKPLTNLRDQPMKTILGSFR